MFSFNTSKKKKSFLQMIEEKNLDDLKNLNREESDLLISILWDKNDIENLEYLRKNHIIDNYDIFHFTYMKIKDGRKYDFSSLLEMIKKYLQSDGLDIYSHWFHENLARDSALDYLKNWINLGVTFNINELFKSCFLPSRKSYELSSYLIDNFEIDTDIIKSVEYQVKIKYNKDDPLSQKLIKKGMPYDEPEVKKTKVLKEFALSQDDSISNISFINKDTVALWLYSSKKRESRIEIFCLKKYEILFSFKFDIKSFSPLKWCAWRNGVGILTKKHLTYIPLDKNLKDEKIFLDNEGIKYLSEKEKHEIINYKIDNIDTLKSLLYDPFLREPEYLDIKALDDKNILVHYSTPSSQTGRALGIIKVNESDAQIINIYKQLDEKEIIDELGVGEFDPYIYLYECTFSHDNIWCLAGGSTLFTRLEQEYPSTFLTSYNFEKDYNLAANNNSKNLLLNFLDNVLGNNADQNKYKEPFNWNKTKIKIPGEKVFFSDDGKYIWSRVSGKNRMFCHDIKTGDIIYEIRITKAQSLKEIPYKDANVRMYDDKQFIVYSSSSWETNSWNICEIIN